MQIACISANALTVTSYQLFFGSNTHSWKKSHIFMKLYLDICHSKQLKRKSLLKHVNRIVWWWLILILDAIHLCSVSNICKFWRCIQLMTTTEWKTEFFIEMDDLAADGTHSALITRNVNPFCVHSTFIDSDVRIAKNSQNW